MLIKYRFSFSNQVNIITTLKVQHMNYFFNMIMNNTVSICITYSRVVINNLFIETNFLRNF